ncbi:MAG: hypothetical protein V4594_09490 [Bacteroidota bacterium]
MGIEELLLDRAKKEGKAEGKVEGKIDLIEKMITELGLSDEQIARAADMSVEFVAKIRTGLKQK